MIAAALSPQLNDPGEYRRRFIVRVHQLLALGYERMERQAADQEEEVISGWLAKSIDEVLCDEGSESWVDFFSIHNEAPVHESDRSGKRRRRIDFILKSGERPRGCFSIEAKRLGKRHSEAAYLGDQGLGRFIRGIYAKDEDESGMLGYVQSGDPQRWAQSVGDRLQGSPQAYAVHPQSPWRRHPIVPVLEHTYRSGHRRESVGRMIEIYHTLLDFR